VSSAVAGTERYKALLYGEGLLKTIFKAVKAAGSGMGLDRAFTTGVAPVVLSDLSSGYNIAENISLIPAYHDLCGFHETEVAALLTQVTQECELPAAQATDARTMVQQYYNGYCFNTRRPAAIYNPTLTLYFLKAFQRECQYPQDMLDSNLAMDRGKIAYVAALPQGAAVLADALDDTHLPAISELARSFGVADMLRQIKDTSFMVSLLYYFGVLTHAGYTDIGELRFRIPNLVVRKLYVDQLCARLLPEREQQQQATEAAHALYRTGDLQPLCEFIETRYFRVLDNRDYRWANELTVKMAFLTLVFDDRFYIVDSEPALERSYADLTLIVRPDMRHFALQDALLEFKYLSLPDLSLTGEAIREMPRAELAALPLVAALLAEATHKAEGYRSTLEAAYQGRLRLHTYAIVALGFDRLVWVKL